MTDTASESQPGDTPPSLAATWGAWAARRHWWVLSVWIVLLIAAAAAYPYLESTLVAPDYSVTDSDSDRVADLISEDFTTAGAEQDVVVFNSDTLVSTDADYRAVVDSVLADVRDEPGVVFVLGPYDPGGQQQVSADGHASLASVGLSGDIGERADQAASLQDTIASAASGAPVEAYLTGFSPSSNDLTTVETEDVERAESIGIPVAFVVLVLAFGALVAALLPLTLAGVGLTATMGVLAALTVFQEWDVFVISVITMIGVGIGIDYSLFIVTRFREELARGAEGPDAVPAAVGRAMTTSGRTIAFSAFIVMISLFSLFVVNSPMFREIAIGSVLVVATTLVAAWTFLPALLGAIGHRVNRGALPKRFQPADEQEREPDRPSGWARWAHTVLAHPWLAIPAAALLVVFSLPTFGIKLGIDLGLAALADTPSGKAEIILAEKFSPGVLSPVQILVSHQGAGPLTDADLATIDELTRRLSDDPRVDGAFSITEALDQLDLPASAETLATLGQLEDPTVRSLLGQYVNIDSGSNRAILTVVSSAPIDSTEATDLVNDLRDDIVPSLASPGGPEILVGGATATFADLADETLGKLPLVLGLVLTLSFVYLTVVFRSLLIPLKAVAMNLLATGAAFGLTVWVFQEGHLEGLLNFESVGFIQVYLPIMTFALLFGLSMDYEVFLIRRMQEEWVATHDNDQAVAVGLAHTARPIAAAAAIMAAVFGCFLVADVLELKQFGLALAAAVVLDATLVRLVLVPAIMKLAGPANWWLPGFLERILPRVRLE